MDLEIVVCEGDETGQDLLVQALRVLDAGLTSRSALLEGHLRPHRSSFSMTSRVRTSSLATRSFSLRALSNQGW